jgi:hypothetical protein
VTHPHRWRGATWVWFTGFWRGIGLACAALLLVATPRRAQTTRPEAVTRAILSVERMSYEISGLQDAVTAATANMKEVAVASRRKPPHLILP